MNRTRYHILAAAVFWLLFAVPAESTPTIKRHLVLYGGFDDAAIATIADNAEILVVGRIRHDQLQKLKKAKPGIIVLKYQHALSVPKGSRPWKSAVRNQKWFATDRLTSERLVQDRYGWYLMNIANMQWRDFLVENIADSTEALFDGVFLDDCWDHYVSKFVTEKGRKPGDPRQEIIHNWQQYMTQMLAVLRSRYAKLIFINGAHECYISYVDGVMDESFIHANWHTETYFHPRANDLRSIDKIKRLSRYKKPILVQSGTSGKAPDRIDSVFRYCLMSYLLVTSDHTYFNFHPAHTYHYRKIYFHPLFKLAAGSPKNGYHVHSDRPSKSNLVVNGDFDGNIKGWRVISGKPAIDSIEALEGRSIRFAATGARRDMLASDYLPVAPGVEYTLSAYCKSKRNIPGSANYKRLGFQGRFYDREKRKIPGAFDLKVSAGTYGWQYYEATFISPPDAATFQLRVGFIGDGVGSGWIDRIYFGPTSYGELVYRRDFSNGSVFVNMGNRPYVFPPDAISGSKKAPTITIHPRQGMWRQDDGRPIP